MLDLKVAVIIVNYNSTELLKKCLLALRQQAVQPARVLLLDNGSSELLPDLKAFFPTVEVIISKDNLGFAAGNNRLVEQINDCEWIALLNPDAFPDPDWLKHLINATQMYPECSFFGSRLLCAEKPDYYDGTGDVYHVSGRVWRRDFLKPVSTVNHSETRIFSPCAAAALYRRKEFQSMQGLDESYFCYLEDIDLGFRLRLLGHECRYIPEATVYHMGSAVTKRHSDFYVYHGHRNIVWTYVKNMPGVLFWIYLPQHIILNIFSVFYFGLKGQIKTILRAKWDALKGLPSILKKRKQIQAQRKVSIFEIRKLMARGLPFKMDC